MIKNVIKNYISQNTFRNDFFYCHFKPQIEAQMAEIINKQTLVDMLEDQTLLREYRKSVAHGTPWWSYNLNKSQNRMYGICNSVFSGINDRNLFFPALEHGLFLFDGAYSDTTDASRAGAITFGRFRRDILLKCQPLPIYCVGPYIHYASDYYSPEVMEAKKERLGKNLLAFPTHGTNSAELSFAEEAFLEKILSMKSSFDSVSVCVYWWNINDPFVERYRKEDIKIVCAGMREDTNFLSRQKAMIGLSDFVIGDSVGTHIGYCLSQDKPFSFFESGTSMKYLDQCEAGHLDFSDMQREKIKSVFADASGIDEKQRELYNYYWGGDMLRTPEEIRSIYIVNKRITNDCRGNRKKFGDYARKLVSDKLLENDTEHGILKEALGM